MRFLIFVLLVLSNPVSALTLKGYFNQGGFALGQVPYGTKVYLDDLEIPTTDEGDFALPFNRNLKNPTLKLVNFDGTEQIHKISLKTRTYETQNVKGVQKKHVTPDPEHLKRIGKESEAITNARESITNLDAEMLFDMIKPSEGRTSGVYGSKRLYNGQERTWHKGWDIAAKTGTKVVAPTDAVVALALPDSFFNGNLLVLDHGRGLYSIYAHLHKMFVKTGDKLTKGQLMAEVGTTGRSTGPHLHWGLYWRNIGLDPQLLMDAPTEVKF